MTRVGEEECHRWDMGVKLNYICSSGPEGTCDELACESLYLLELVRMLD